MIILNEMTELCKLFYKHGSDKCPQIYHSYSPEYYNILKHLREQATNILEIGIGTDKLMRPIVGDNYIIGASLYAWKDFFHNAKIYALDIDKDVFFTQDRIRCYYTDQSNKVELKKTIKQIFKENGKVSFDIIIDDGSHKLDHQILTYNTLFNYLAKGGIYIIEDVKREYLDKLKKINKADSRVICVHDGNKDLRNDCFIAFRKKE
jgi:hypothetical protein